MPALVYERKGRAVIYLHVILNVTKCEVIAKKWVLSFWLNYLWIEISSLTEKTENLKTLKPLDQKLYVVISCINPCSKEIFTGCFLNKIDKKNSPIILHIVYIYYFLPCS